MDFPEARKFLLASFRDLPNILFIGSLIIGSVLGYLPLIWLALGLIFNGAVTALFQIFLKTLLEVKAWPEKWKPWLQMDKSTSQSCFVGFQPNVANSAVTTESGMVIVAPSQWMSATTFFAAFSIYNSVQVARRNSNGKVDQKLKSTRTAFSISTAIIGAVFFGLLFSRFFFQCETIFGGALGIAIGIGMGIGYWYILNLCGTGKMPDILQVIGSMAPDASKAQQPVMCTAPTE
jgi:hypothetical protein